MMKKILLIALALVLFGSAFLTAQENKTADGEKTVDIRAIVQHQINDIKAREESAKNENVLLSEFDGKEFFIGRSALTKLYVFIEGSLLIILLIYVKRKLSDSEKYRIQTLKENINKLRAEKIGSRSGRELYQIRRKLRLQPAAKSGREITMRAKKMNISKGEIYLAAKLNMMMSQNR
ncbi:MAG: hypothetical protein GXO87_11100 [Chlorobi bacterium]|nr:hypothetical protein [Chlorobiota bacterium]